MSIAHKGVHGGVAVDCGGRRDSDALGCGNDGHRNIGNVHVDLGLQQNSTITTAKTYYV